MLLDQMDLNKIFPFVWNIQQFFVPKVKATLCQGTISLTDRSRFYDPRTIVWKLVGYHYKGREISQQLKRLDSVFKSSTTHKYLIIVWNCFLRMSSRGEGTFRIKIQTKISNRIKRSRALHLPLVSL